MTVALSLGFCPRSETNVLSVSRPVFLWVIVSPRAALIWGSASEFSAMLPTPWSLVRMVVRSSCKMELAPEGDMLNSDPIGDNPADLDDWLICGSGLDDLWDFPESIRGDEGPDG